jgi:hypothetical protein
MKERTLLELHSVFEFVCLSYYSLRSLKLGPPHFNMPLRVFELSSPYFNTLLKALKLGLLQFKTLPVVFKTQPATLKQWGPRVTK